MKQKEFSFSFLDNVTNNKSICTTLPDMCFEKKTFDIPRKCFLSQCSSHYGEPADALCNIESILSVCDDSMHPLGLNLLSPSYNKIKNEEKSLNSTDCLSNKHYEISSNVDYENKAEMNFVNCMKNYHINSPGLYTQSDFLPSLYENSFNVDTLDVNYLDKELNIASKPYSNDDYSTDSNSKGTLTNLKKDSLLEYSCSHNHDTMNGNHNFDTRQINKDIWNQDNIISNVEQTSDSRYKKSNISEFSWLHSKFQPDELYCDAYSKPIRNSFDYLFPSETIDLKETDTYKLIRKSENSYFESTENNESKKLSTHWLNHSPYRENIQKENSPSMNGFEYCNLNKPVFHPDFKNDNGVTQNDTKFQLFPKQINDIIKHKDSSLLTTAVHTITDTSSIYDYPIKTDVLPLTIVKPKTTDTCQTDIAIDYSPTLNQPLTSENSTNEKTILSPIVLAHPEEFKNPSSFLKVYGDPLCHKRLTETHNNSINCSPGHMILGRNGNWGCERCGNVNYPRRFRCNKCNEMRDANGDAIVAEYAAMVYETHLKAYRHLPKGKDDNVSNEVSNNNYRTQNSKDNNFTLRRTYRRPKQSSDGIGGSSKSDYNKNSNEFSTLKKDDTRHFDTSKCHEDNFFSIGNTSLVSNLQKNLDRNKNNNDIFTKNWNSLGSPSMTSWEKIAQHNRYLKKKDNFSTRKLKNDYSTLIEHHNPLPVTESLLYNSQCRNEIPETTTESSGVHYNSNHLGYCYVST